jgi:YYY domain-containing protein
VELLFAFRWFLVLQLFGLAALPLTLSLLRYLPGRGYAFARPLGLLLGGWVFWCLGTLGWLPNTPGAVLVALALLLAAGVALWMRSPRAGASLSWRHVLVVEALLLAAFVGWCLVRAHMPRIETAGGEKWMEIAFLNAVLRAPRFPPQDPWLSGFAISYYYFGYVIVAMLVHLSAVPSTIGFNLGVATLFALTCTGAYGVVYGMLGAERRREATWGGFLGPLMVTLVGNLEGLLEVLHARGLLPAGFWRCLDITSIDGPPPPFSLGSWVPSRFIWWWQASRVIQDYGPTHTPQNPVEWLVIDEFPAFSFLLGDMHPHLLALPFVLLALALALSVVLRRRREGWNLGLDVALPLRPWELFVYAICLGGLGFLNTWDFPIYLFVVVAAFALSFLVRNSPLSMRSLLAFAFLLAVGGFLLYSPFWLGFRSQAAGILPNVFNGTRVPQFLVMFGPLLFPVGVMVVAEARRRRVGLLNLLAWVGMLVLGLSLFLLVAALVTPEVGQVLEALRTGGAIPGLEDVDGTQLLVAGRLLDRLRSPWTLLVVSALLGAALLALPGWRRQGPRAALLGDSGAGVVVAYGLLLTVTGALLVLSVEFVYLRDNFGTRMNTVFKFYFQAWAMWGVVGAYVLARCLTGGRWWIAALGLLLIGAGLVYPVLGIPARAREYGGEPTLDGAAHLRDRHAEDLAAIDWLNENVEGTPVILEAPADRYRAYDYEGRVSAFTGLPTLLGWAGHQHQWRGDYDEPSRREPDIERLYASADAAETLTLLDRYGIRYVYVGPLERQRYPAAALGKFDQLLDVVYSAGQVTIYRYLPAAVEGSAIELEPELPQPDERGAEP